MGKKVKIGNERQPAPLVTTNVPLYNLQTGQPLTDEGGTPLVSSEDTFLASKTSSDQALSIAYTEEKRYKENKNIRLSGKNFSATGKTITCQSGTGLFRGVLKYRITFSATDVITGLSVGTTVENARTEVSGVVESISFNKFNTGGFFILKDYNSTIFIEDEFTFGTESITVVESSFVGKPGELNVGDRLLLPTGLVGTPAKKYYTPKSGTKYTPSTGDLELVIGDHDLYPGLKIKLAANSLTFTCALDPSKPKSYPRASGENGTLVNPLSNNNIGKADPAYDTEIEINAVTATSITVNVGVSSDTSAHTFVSADTNAVTAPEVVFYTPGVGTNYNPSNGNLELYIGDHSILPGTTVRLNTNSLKFTCALDGNTTIKSYPRESGEDGTGTGAGNNLDKPDPAYQTDIKVVSVTGNSIIINVGTSSDTSAHTFVSADANAVVALAPQKVYETRTVTNIVSNDECEISLEVTYDRELFGELIKLRTVTVDPTLKIEEQFSSFSEVSTTILGYPKAEEQLGLFSNVSTYGLDDDEFIFYSRDSGGIQGNWDTRRNKTYGNHYLSRYREVKQEAAIAIESYRTPYSYPWGPGDGGYSSENYTKFNTFLKLGALLYDFYKDTDPAYAQNFLPYTANHVSLSDVVDGPNVDVDNLDNTINSFNNGENIKRTDTNQVIGTVRFFRMQDKVLHFNQEIGYILTNSGLQNIPIVGETTGTTANITSDMTYDSFGRYFSNFVTPLNPSYSSVGDFFAQIDTWTETYRRMIKEDFNRPNGSPLDAAFVQNLSLVQTHIISALEISGTVLSNDLTRPGYSTGLQTRAYLESRKAFRYQPGRISGYTFGVRASNDARDDNNVIIEWGIGNDTDDLVFQIRGSSFSIVRRSVVPLEDSVLEANSLQPEDQVLITKDTQNNTVFTGLENKQVYETVISRDKWNGDQLNGNGPSGHLWRAESVTMYKIEFGWYGAIGVQFYAYVPVSAGEARWVKLHRLVIENQLGQPCMGDPYYKFKYSLVTLDHANVKTPQYIYKYGTSCYIDGGDEGTVRVNSATSEPKVAPLETNTGAQLSTSLVAIQPKTTITNSIGEIIKNKQQIFPRELSVNSTGLTEVTIVKCKSCPGYGHTYQPNLNAGYNGDERSFAFPTVAGGYDRSRVDLKILTKNVTSSTGSTLTLSDLQFVRVGDIIRNVNIPQIPNDTIITAIDTNTNVVTLNNSLTGSFTGNLEIQPVFLKRDLYSKIIGSRIWNTYVWQFDDSTLINISGEEERYTTALLGTVDSGAVSGTQQLRLDEYLIERILPDYYRTGSGANTTFVPFPSEFDGRLSQYKALAASSIPVSGRKNSLLFLMAEKYDNGSYSNGQFADYRLGVTSLRPEFDGVNTITWYDQQNQEREFTDDYKLFAERFNEGIARDIDGYETGETNFGRVRPFTVDYRIEQPPGTNSGTCAFLNITVNPAGFVECQQVKGSTLFPTQAEKDYIISLYPDYDENAYYLRAANLPFDFNPQNAEIGFDENDPTGSENPPTIGSGIFFDSPIITYQDQNTTLTYDLIKITNNLPGQTDPSLTTVVIWYVPISLETYRKLATRAFNFNPFPLYFFVEMKDGSRVNGPMIREETQVLNSYNPRWYTTNEMTVSNDSIQVGPIGDVVSTTGDLTQSPPNFVDNNRLSSALIDTQNQSQLRPYEVIDKLYVGQDTKTISLKNIFDFEKETITPDLLNTTAYFFLATSKETDPNNERSVQATLTYIEQQ